MILKRFFLLGDSILAKQLNMDVNRIGLFAFVNDIKHKVTPMLHKEFAMPVFAK